MHRTATTTLYRLFMSIITSFFLFLFFLPTLFSLPVVQSVLFFTLEKTVKYEIDCNSADLGWFSGIHIENLKIKRKNQYDYISISSLHSEKPMYSYFTNPRNLGKIEIDGLEAIFSEDIEGISVAHALHTEKNNSYYPVDFPIIDQNVEKKTATKEITTSPSIKNTQFEYALPDIDLQLDMKNSRAFVSKIGPTFSSIEDLSLAINRIQNPSQLQLSMSGNVASSLSESKAPFQIEISLLGKELFSDLEGKISAHLREIPSLIVEGILSLLNQRFVPFISSLIGQKCSLSVESDINFDIAHISSSLISDNLKSFFNLTLSSEEIKLNKAKLLECTISKEFFEHIMYNVVGFSGKECSLQKPVKLSLSIDEPTVYSLQTESFSTPFLLKFAHSPTFVIERNKQNPLFLNCQFDCRGDTTGEKISCKVTSGYHRMNEEIEASLFITMNKPQSQFQIAHGVYRLFKGDFSLSGNCIQLLSEELQLPLQQFLGPSLTATCHTTGFISDANVISYKGSYNAILEHGSKQGVFHGDQHSLSIEKCVSSLFIPYQNCLEALHQQREDYIFSESSGIQIKVDFMNCIIPFHRITDDILCNSTFQCAVDLISHPIESLYFSCATDANLQSYLRMQKSEKSHQISVNGHIDIPFAKIPKPFLEHNLSRSMPLQVNYSSLLGIEKGIITCLVKEITCRLHNTIQLQVQNMLCSYFLQTKESKHHSSLAEISIPSPLHILTKTAPLHDSHYFHKDVVFVTNAYFYTKLPIQISKNKNIFSGLISSKIECDLENDKKMCFSFPCTIDISKRIIEGSCILKELNESEGIRQDRAIIEYVFELPYKITKAALLDEATYRCNISSKKMNFQECTPFLSPKVIKMLSNTIGNSLHKCDIKSFFRGITSSENELEGSIITEKVAIKAHIESKDGNLIASKSKPFLLIEAKLQPEAIRTLFPKSSLHLSSDQECISTISIEKVNIPIKKLKSDLSLKEIHLFLKETSADFYCKNTKFTLESTDSKFKKKYEIPESKITTSFSGKNGFIASTIMSSHPTNLDLKNNINGKITAKIDLFDLQQSMQNLNCDVDISAHHIDSFLFLKMINMDKSLSSLLGKTVSFSLTGSITQGFNGAGSCEFKSKNCMFKTSGIFQNGEFFPLTDIESKIFLTKKSHKFLFKKMPSLFSISTSFEQQPILCTIPYDKVLIPIMPFLQTKIYIPKGRILLNTFFLEKIEGIAEVLLRSLQKNSDFSGKPLRCTATPILFSMQNGIVTCDRCDFLIEEKLHISIWGDIDFKHDKIAMTLFIPNITLAEIGFPLSSQAGITIPISGKLSHPQIDVKKLTTHIALDQIQKSLIKTKRKKHVRNIIVR